MNYTPDNLSPELSAVVAGLFDQTDVAKLREQFGAIADAAGTIGKRQTADTLRGLFYVGAACDRMYRIAGGKRGSDDAPFTRATIDDANPYGWAAVKRVLSTPRVLTPTGGDALTFHGFTLRTLSRAWDAYRSNACEILPRYWEAMTNDKLTATAPNMFTGDSNGAIAFALAVMQDRVRGDKVILGSNRGGTGDKIDTRTAAEKSADDAAKRVALGREILAPEQAAVKIAGTRWQRGSLAKYDDDALRALIVEASAILAARRADKPQPAAATAAKVSTPDAPKGSRPAKRAAKTAA